MPSTQNFALPYPGPLDGPDGPGAIYSLAKAVDDLLSSLQKKTSGVLNGSSPGIVSPLFVGKGQQIEVTVQAPNYLYRFLLWVSNSPVSGNTSQVTVIASHTIDNTAAYGPVTQWTTSGGNLYATIAGAGTAQINFGARNILTGA